MRNFLMLLTLLFSSSVFGQLNMTELGRLDIPTIHGVGLADIWGWSDGSGNEYALVGTTDGLSVVDVTDPANPVEVYWKQGYNSIWRDVKTYNGYAYVTTEAGEGLLIVNLNALPSIGAGDTTHYFGGGNPWKSAHNLYIDENGRAYIFGADRGNGGAIMLDLTTNPMNPTEVGVFDNWYIHDGMARGDTLYSAHINDGFFSITDVSDPMNPVVLGTSPTPSNFTHNCWVSDDGDNLYTTDERAASFVGAYDIIDPTDIKELDKIRSNPDTNSIPHNTHFINDYVVTSWYRDGVVIHDVSKPHNMVEVGNFDTSPSMEGGGFEGCWGVYPWLPSGNIIASDRQNGLFILGANYVRGAFLEGHVSDIQTSASINQVNVELLNTSIQSQTDLVGDYYTGAGQGGTYDVVFSKPTYFPDTVQGVVITNGNTTILDHQLEPMPPFTLTVTVVEAGSNNPIQNASVKIENEDFLYNETTDVNGEVTIFPFYEYDYDVLAGKWGRVSSCREDVHFDSINNTITLELDSGYYDDFELDYGWTVSGNASSGMWVRDIPSPTGSPGDYANPVKDADFDCFGRAYITGNQGSHPDADDIDDGYTELTSPMLDLSGMTDPYINYKRYFYDKYGPYSPDDSMLVYLKRGTTLTGVDTITHADTADLGKWNDVSIRVLDHVPTNIPIQIIVRAADLDTFVNIVEAGFDYLYVSEGDVSSVTEEVPTGEVNVFPNPFESGFTVESDILGQMELRDLSGRRVAVKDKTAKREYWSIDLPKGIYLLIIDNGEEKKTHKIIR